MNKPIVFDRPQKLAVVKMRGRGRVRMHSLPRVVACVEASSLREGVEHALAAGVRGSFEVMPCSEVAERMGIKFQD